jgi:hypothetical protein
VISSSATHTKLDSSSAALRLAMRCERLHQNEYMSLPPAAAVRRGKPGFFRYTLVSLKAELVRRVRTRAVDKGGLTMKKEVQDALETAIAGFEKRQDAEQQRLREREKFETEWIRNRTVIVVPALEEIKALLSKARWQCEVRPEKDQDIHFTIYRENMKAGIGAGGSERPYMSFQPEKEKNTVLVYVATIGSGAGLGSFALDQITEDFVQAEASKFFVRLASGT